MLFFFFHFCGFHENKFSYLHWASTSSHVEVSQKTDGQSNWNVKLDLYIVENVLRIRSECNINLQSSHAFFVGLYKGALILFIYLFYFISFSFWVFFFGSGGGGVGGWLCETVFVSE